MKKQQTLQNRLYKHKITEEEYLGIIASQNSLCAICDRELTLSGKGRSAVDHCHSLGTIRGILCQFCNIGLGYYEKMDISRVEHYLENNANITPRAKTRTRIPKTSEEVRARDRARYHAKKAEN